MARKSDQFVFSGERPSPAAAEIPIAFNNRRQPPVSHQPQRPQQLPDLSPAAERRAPILGIPITFNSGLSTHDNRNWVPANEEWSSVDDQISRLPDTLDDVVYGSAQRITTNHWWRMSEDQHSGLPPRPRPPITHDNSIRAPGSPVDDQMPDTINEDAVCEVTIREEVVVAGGKRRRRRRR